MLRNNGCTCFLKKTSNLKFNLTRKLTSIALESSCNSISKFISYQSGAVMSVGATKVVLIRLGIYVFVNKARGGGSPKFFINTL